MNDDTVPVQLGQADIDARPFVDAQRGAQARYGRFNLAVVGNTGVGKSSLVNTIFGRDIAKVGKGLPVTQGIHYYSDASLGIWDFEGFEIGSTMSPGQQLLAHLEMVKQRPKDEQISVVWYCVASTADRLTRPDIEMIQALHSSGLPVILVLTKVNWAKNPLSGQRKPPRDVEAFRDWLEDPHDGELPLYLPIEHVVLTSTVDRNGKGAGHGLGDLLTLTLALSPDDEKDAFRIAQRLNLGWKRDMARPVVAAASAAAAGAAAVPIPVADAVVLAPIQLTMMGRISAIYELELTTMLSATALAQLGAQISGQALARSFVKLVPGVGSVVNSSVAFALTGAMGEGWMRLCERVHSGKLDVSKIEDHWNEFVPHLPAVLKHLVGAKKK